MATMSLAVEIYSWRRRNSPTPKNLACLIGNVYGKAPLKGFGMITISDDMINIGLRGYDGESYC